MSTSAKEVTKPVTIGMQRQGLQNFGGLRHKRGHLATIALIPYLTHTYTGLHDRLFNLRIYPY